jgi:WbqC-like protein
MICTFHQPNVLPGASVIQKVLAADAVIWMDTVAYTKGGFTNRNRLPDGSWMTIPVERHCAFKPINQVRIGEPAKDWREPIIHGLVNAWPGEVTAAVCREILRPYPLLVGLNAALLRILLDALGYQGEQHWQSHLDAGHAVEAVSGEKARLAPISQRIAEMVANLGGTIYLSGPSGKKYLDEEPFEERGVEVAYWSHAGENPCALALVNQRMEVAA